MRFFPFCTKNVRPQQLKSNAILMPLLMLFLFRMETLVERTPTTNEWRKIVSAVCFIFDVSFWYIPSSVCDGVSTMYWQQLWRMQCFVLLHDNYCVYICLLCVSMCMWCYLMKSSNVEVFYGSDLDCVRMSVYSYECDGVSFKWQLLCVRCRLMFAWHTNVTEKPTMTDEW